MIKENEISYTAAFIKAANATKETHPEISEAFRELEALQRELKEHIQALIKKTKKL